MFKVGDIVWVSNPDKKYEKEICSRKHENKYGKVIEVCNNNTIGVEFDEDDTWYYHSDELSLYEPTMESIIYKHGENDYAVWQLDIPTEAIMEIENILDKYRNRGCSTRGTVEDLVAEWKEMR